MKLMQAEISFHALEMRLQAIIAKNIDLLIGARRGSRSLAGDPAILTSWHIAASMLFCRQLHPPDSSLLDLPFNARAHAGYFYPVTSTQSPQLIVN